MTENNQLSDRASDYRRFHKIAEPEFYDGQWDLHPSADVFLSLEDELTDLHSTEIDLDWATKRIKQGLLDWVSSAIVIKKVFRFRLWKDKFTDWKDYSTRGLGKKPEWIKMLIDRADVIIELAKAGFTILPTNQSQVGELIRCCKKLNCLIYDAWDKVINAVPESLITAKTIAEVLGFPPLNVNYRVPHQLDDRLSRRAIDLDMSTSELHISIVEDWLSYQDELESPTDNEEESTQSEEIEPDEIEAWERDVKKLVAEHDHQNWLMVSVIKLISLIKPRSSQFSYLNDIHIGYQT